jgi:hypothetical protein
MMKDTDQKIGQDEGKICTKCGEWKLLDEYYKQKAGKHGLHSWCKPCFLLSSKEYRANNKDTIAATKRKYREDNKEKVAAASKRWREENKDKKKADDAAWREENRERFLSTSAEYKKNNPEKVKEWKKDWAEKNPDKIREARKKYYEKKRSTPKGRVELNVSNNMRSALKKGAKANRSVFKILGYTVEALMTHLEQRFQSGMTWENYGDWHIDHIVPLAAHQYDSTEDLEFKKAWALSNLQPLWAADNCSKGAKILPRADNDNVPDSTEEVA